MCCAPAGISPPTVPAPSPSTAPAKRTPRKLALILGALAVGLCLCLACGAVALATRVQKALNEKPKVEKVLDGFMIAMANQHSKSAYALFSTRSKRNTSLSDIEKLLQGNNYVLFDGYQNVTITRFILATSSTNPDLPRGTIIKVEGTISYQGGFTGTFNAVLERDDGEWRLFSINVTVPPDKLISP